MSDLPRSAAVLARSTPQLPAAWYLDPKIYAIEQRTLFANGPHYLGHELMVPNVGDYHTLRWMDDAKMLVRNAHGVEVVSNICRHRQAIMLAGRGHAEHIVCPVHRWTYGLDGKLIGAPHFGENPCKHLAASTTQRWNGLIFGGRREVERDLANLGVAAELDFSGYVYDRTVVNEYHQNWKTFIEVYLEDYHVEPFHPGLGRFVTCKDLQWEFASTYSVQTVGLNNHLANPGTPTYARWHEAVRNFRGGEDPPHGAIWMLYYPNVMLEWYPHVLVVSSLIPRGPQHTTNVVEFYYPEEIALFEREYVQAQQAAYLETAAEDDEIAVRMDRGRKALYDAGEDDAGPYQCPMEDGMVRFHEYIRLELVPHLKPEQE